MLCTRGFSRVHLSVCACVCGCNVCRGCLTGKWVPAVSGKTFQSYNPATGDALSTVAHGDAKDVNLAVKAARAAFDDGPWRKLTASERGKIVWRIGELITKHVGCGMTSAPTVRGGVGDDAIVGVVEPLNNISVQGDELAELESLDNGKPRAVARVADVALAADLFQYMAGWCVGLATLALACYSCCWEGALFRVSFRSDVACRICWHSPWFRLCRATKIHGRTFDISVPYAPGARFNASTRREAIGVAVRVVDAGRTMAAPFHSGLCSTARTHDSSVDGASNCSLTFAVPARQAWCESVRCTRA